MFYYASKVAGFVTTPSNLLVSLVLAGAVLALVPRLRRVGLAAAAVFAAATLVAGLSPLSSLLILPLEERFPVPPDDGTPVAGIVLLGGAVEADDSAALGQVVSNDSADRVLATIALAHRHPAARIVISGGGGAANLWRFFAFASEGLRRLDVAVKEWAGLLAYRAAGRTGELFPGP